MIKKLMRNISLVLFGCLLSLILIEGLFRLVPLFLSQDIPEINQSAYRILCIGDSSTYGTGTNERKTGAYPAKLQEILKKHNTKPVQVINLGLPGINSAQALSYFKQNIHTIKPHAIIVCIGINDLWNFENSKVFDYYRSDNTVQFIFVQIKKLLSWLKVVRFIKLNLINKTSENKVFPIPTFTRTTVLKNDGLMPDHSKQRQAIRENLKYNLLKFKEIARQNHRNIFFLEYHAPGWRNPEVIIHELYQSLNLEYIPAYNYFAILDSHNLDIRSRDNWHLNDFGYDILLKIICSYLHQQLPINVPYFENDIGKLLKHE